jgi:hypothetical protein
MFLMRRVVSAAALAVTGAVAFPAADALAADSHPDTVSSDRATVRDTPSGLVLANARHGDTVDRQLFCGEWVRVRVRPKGHAMATRTGWMLRGDMDKSQRKNGLAGVPRNCAAANTDRSRWRSFVGAVNSPRGSLRFVRGKGEKHRTWHHVSYGTPIAALSGQQCVPSYNYIRDAAGERPDPVQRVTNVDLAHPSYRYATHTGTVALVAVPRTDGHSGSIWAFVAAGCVQPDRAAGYETVYFPHVVQVDHLPTTPIPTDELKRYGCHGPVHSAINKRLGWVWNPANKPACPH